MRQHSTRPTARTGPRAVTVGTAVGLLAALLPVSGAQAADPRCADRGNDTYEELLDCVTLAGVRAHQLELQEIAEDSTDPHYPGSRAAGTDGHADSVDHVAELLEEAGYEVTLDPVEFDFMFPAVLRQVTPAESDLETGAFTGSEPGELTGRLVPVDVNLTGDRASTSGCEAEDFTGLDLGGTSDIALIQRGTCTFGLKVQNAQTAGAEAVIVFNQGNTPEREGVFVGDVTFLDLEQTIPFDAAIPVVGASFADGEALSAPGSTAFVRVLPTERRTDHNVVAELPGTNADNVVMAGAHLDSVTDGPGINDDGSGTAALLETALMIARSEPQNTVRFAFWAAEEIGLLGSADYVGGLSQADLDRIALYLNFDMVGSPNHVSMIYDADETTFPSADTGVTIPPGSAAIEDLFESWYTLVGEPYDDKAFDGRSDYQAFIDRGIPAGGVFTGAERVKTDAQVAIWGGTAGQQFDPCYHLACDTAENVNEDALERNSDLIAFAVLTYAFSTESVNGVAGSAVPGPAVELPAPEGPRGTFVTTG
ncbi:M20/M25/M40 family metallo-hydrolase [Modestobacter marinus]|uniref:M20/M25/M40 family metallo-hydrolase n=1 Tax=Modestobacter marinus TaxID=477641 RepID=UPI001C9403DF|nr:M20/M25/M40 family metallo-hydrolase [Modestobacter marinus]